MREIPFIILLAPFILQGLAMAFDEFYFHHRRSLPKWERIGHPLDTFTVIACFGFLTASKVTQTNLFVFIGLAFFSSVFVTKDEFIHSEVCEARENWLHALLFVLHPIVFFSAGVIWFYGIHPELLLLQTLLLVLFLFYQVIYWRKTRSESPVTNVNNAIYELYGDRWYTADDDPVALLRAESRAKTPWILEKIRLRFSLSESTRVLDVGCGAGFLANELARHGLSVTGVDLSQDSLQVARAYDTTKAVTYQTADAARLPFEDASFDVLTALDFLEHVENPREIIREFSRVLKPGGLFVFHTFNRNWLAYVIVIKFVEWFVRNTPKHMHILRLFIKPCELHAYCREAEMDPGEIVGLKPVFSSIPIKNVFTGIVPKSMRFEIVKSLLLSYMGIAVKKTPAAGRAL